MSELAKLMLMRVGSGGEHKERELLVQVIHFIGCLGKKWVQKAIVQIKSQVTLKIIKTKINMKQITLNS